MGVIKTTNEFDFNHLFQQAHLPHKYFENTYFATERHKVNQILGSNKR